MFHRENWAWTDSLKKKEKEKFKHLVAVWQERYMIRIGTKKSMSMFYHNIWLVHHKYLA